MKKLTINLKEAYIFFLMIYLVCLPLNAISIGTMGSALRLVAILPMGIAFAAGKEISFGLTIRTQLYFTLYAIASVVWSVARNISIDRGISYLFLFLFLLTGAMFKYTYTDMLRVKCALAWSSRLTAIVMFLFAEYYKGRFRLMGIIEEDPNYLCAYLVFGVVYSLGVLVEKTTKQKKVFAVFELFVYFYLVFVSGSRGGLLAVSGAAVVFFMTYGEKKKNQIESKVILLTLLLGLIPVVFGCLPENLRLRFSISDVISSGASGRVELWAQAFNLFSEGNIFEQLFGRGAATVRWCFENFDYDEVNVVHNMFIETLVELGIVGLILYSLAIFSFAATAFKFKDKFSFAVIFCMFVMSLSTSIYTFKPYFNIMLFVIMLKNARKDEEEKREYLI